jgi:hypothetical protein
MNSVLSRQGRTWASHLRQIVYAIERNKGAVVQVVRATREAIAHDNGKTVYAMEFKGFV